ncbi:glycosyltransferase family 2 protein [Haladaptatus sp. YSMS36]|uniref:glycosyltransferase family 2 protein n=1 Tax=Haladaptatus sp. YSMS36 TaxID=3033384 RepID=UPI0023E8D4B2|nr:glycosyltransferase family 2 protein [Haladaptatus sp. YSMS36]
MYKQIQSSDGDVTQNGPKDKLPTLSLLIAAYNEESTIDKKVKNSLELEYPSDKLEIVVLSDGSTDNTDDIVKRFESQGVTLVRIEGRLGKTQCQNIVADNASGDILVFSDANSMYEPTALLNLVYNFSKNEDETQRNVGAVIGELRYRKDGGVKSESVFNKYERFIKNLESTITSVVGGNGAIYAVKSDSYCSLDPDEISDFAEPLALIREGYAVKYEQSAVAWEDPGESVQDEFNRRIRITTRSWHTISNYLELANPIKYGLFSLQFLSRTLLRWLSPLYLCCIFVSSIILSYTIGGIYAILLSTQLIFYGLSIISAYTDISVDNNLYIFEFSHYFTALNLSLLIGLYNFIRKDNIVTWETENRG